MAPLDVTSGIEIAIRMLRRRALISGVLALGAASTTLVTVLMHTPSDLRISFPIISALISSFVA
jgi:hypothetical protein